MIEYMYNQYKAFVVGTVSLTKKKSRTAGDYPFHKLSGPAQKKIKKGWIRIAQKKVYDGWQNLKYIVQATTWKDKKQVAILHNIHVGEANGARTLRYDKSTHQREAVDTHPIIPNYIKWMRGVDMFDQSMNDYNVSLRGVRWYLRLFYYVVNAALANMRIITKLEVLRERDERKQRRRGQRDRQRQSEEKDVWAHYLVTRGWFK